MPIHGAAVAKDGVCAILCAASGVGKSTLTAAFVRRGWHAVGNDKLLLRVTSDGPELAALQSTFNLHPQTQAWFPKVGELEKLPIYSTWTEKRKVRVDTIWADAVVGKATPTDRAAASLISRTVAPMLSRVRGLDLAVGNDAYRRPDALDDLEAVLR